MTNEEAIKSLINDWFRSLGGQLCVDEDKEDRFLEAIGKAVIALKHPESLRQKWMSDEELYLWAKKQIGCGFDFFPCGVVCDGKCESFDDETCKAKIMEWLKQPVEDTE